MIKKEEGEKNHPRNMIDLSFVNGASSSPQLIKTSREPFPRPHGITCCTLSSPSSPHTQNASITQSIGNRNRIAMMEALVEASEQEVRIEFALNCKCRATVRLRSLCAASPVAFKVQTSSPHKFLVKPPSGLIAPLSHATFQVILKPQPHAPPSFPRSPADRFLVKTARYSSDSPESVNSWFSSLPPTQDLKLKVAFVGPVLLRHAVAAADFEAVRNLIKRQSAVVSDLPLGEAESLVRVASQLRDSDSAAMVNLLVEAGLKVAADGGGWTETARWESKGWSKLHVAAAFDQTDEIASLLGTLGSLDGRDREGRTALHLAVSRGNIACARALVESGANVDATSNDGRTALHRATAIGDRRMVEMLVEIGADPTITNDRGRSALDVARDKGHKEMVESLERGEEALMAARRGEVENLESLLRKGASTKYSDQYGLTALHAAAIKGHARAVRMLVDLGSEMDRKDEEGHEPLHLAVTGGSKETVEVLVRNGANVNAKSKNGATPLSLATVMGYTQISQLLLHNGASPSASLPSPSPSSLASML